MATNCRVHETSGLIVNFKILSQSLGLSLKAIGLHVRVRALAKTGNWEFSVEGIASISKEGPDSILNGIKELERAGLLSRSRERLADGTVGPAIWDIYEEPQGVSVEAAEEGAPIRENPAQVNPAQEKPGQRRELSMKVNKEEKEGAPAPRTGRAAHDAQIVAQTLKIYEEHKPAAWSGKRVLVGPNLDLVKYWIEIFGEKEFYEHLEKALKRAKAEEWWNTTSLTLETLLRKTKTHLTELSEKYDNLQSKPEANGARSYTPRGRPGIPIQKLTIEQIRNL